jgi:hypothetical protein
MWSFGKDSLFTQIHASMFASRPSIVKLVSAHLKGHCVRNEGHVNNDQSVAL